MIEDVCAIVLVLHTKSWTNTSQIPVIKQKSHCIISHLLEHQLNFNGFLNVLQNIPSKIPETIINAITLNIKDIFIYWPKNVPENKVAFIKKERNGYIETGQSQVHMVQASWFFWEFLNKKVFLSTTRIQK